MPEPFFSIVIPTRERHETLHHTLKTCLDQDFDNYEIVVSDNFSSPATRETVQAFNSEKIRYYRTPQPLSMTNNFEFAVEQARGEYIILIGDDDALLPGALTLLSRLIQLAPPDATRAIRWETAFYYWPDMLFEEYRNQVFLPSGTQMLVLDGETFIRNVASYKFLYMVLPMLYHSAVHRSLIQEMRQRTGHVFNALSPDVYSGFAVAYLAGKYAYVGEPLSLFGQSGKSNGWANALGRKDITTDFYQLNRNDGRSLHPLVPEILNHVSVAIQDGFHHAKDDLFPERDDLSYDEQAFLMRLLVDTDSPVSREENIRKARAALETRPELLSWLDTVLVPNLDGLVKSAEWPEPPLNLSQRTHTVNVAARYGFHHISDVARHYQAIRVDVQRATSAA